MNNLTQADIFFFIASVGLILVVLFVSAVLIYVVSILNDIKKVFRIVRKGTNYLTEDIDDLKSKAKENGVRPLLLFGFLRSIYKRYRKR